MWLQGYPHTCIQTWIKYKNYIQIENKREIDNRIFNNNTTKSNLIGNINARGVVNTCFYSITVVRSFLFF
jgi:hypothetical protein